MKKIINRASLSSIILSHNRLREENEKEIVKLNNTLDEKNEKIKCIRKRIAEVRMNALMNYKVATKENCIAQQDLEDIKQLCEQHIEKNKYLQYQIATLQKYIQNVLHEISFLKQENRRLRYMMHKV